MWVMAGAGMGEVSRAGTHLLLIRNRGLSRGNIVLGSRGLVKKVHIAHQSRNDIPYMSKEPENVASEQSCFAKDPGKMVAVPGPVMDEGADSFVSKGNLGEGGGSCSVVTVARSGSGSVIFIGSLDLLGEFLELLGGSINSGVPSFNGGVLACSAAGGGMISSGAAGLVASSGVSRGQLAADFEGSVVSSELIVPAVPIGGLSCAEIGSLVIPSCLSFGVRRGAGPTGVKSLGVLGVGCDGGLCVGEGRFLVPTAGGTVPDPGSDRAAGTVFLGPSGSFSGLVSCF
ncbi:hypothetical protein ACOSP7_029115 [Xanthoceras sorbifolium]